MEFVDLNDIVMPKGIEVLRIISRYYCFSEYENTVPFVEHSFK